MSWWENLIIASFLFSISDQTSKQCVRVPKFLRNSQYIVQWQWEKKQMICVDLRIVNHLRGFDLQKVSRKTKWARSQSSSSCDNAKIDGRRNGTCSSHWSRSSCWSDGRWCPATAAPARSSRTPPTAVSCYRPPPPPPPAKTPRLTAPAARSEAARRGRAARAGGRGGASSRAGAAASPSPQGCRRLPNESRSRGARLDLPMYTAANPSTAARSRLETVGMDGVAWGTCQISEMRSISLHFNMISHRVNPPWED